MSEQNNEGSFLDPDEARELYPDIAPVYQRAFGDEPWFEVSICPAPREKFDRCVGGLSSVAISSMCDTCGLRPSTPAYEAETLVEKFEGLAATRPTLWYMERDARERITFAAVAWIADAPRIASEKYEDMPAMASWLQATVGPDEVIWLDEVFADRTVKPKGNLARFEGLCRGLGQRFGLRTIAYRTINERMTAVASRDFGAQAKVYERSAEGFRGEVPDRRDFVVVDLTEKEQL